MLITLARKPLAGIVAANVVQHGVGALNIDASRIRTEGESFTVRTSNPLNRKGTVGSDMGFSKRTMEEFQQAQRDSIERTRLLGRWPANVLLCGDEVLAGFPMTTTNKGPLKTNAELGRHIALAPSLPGINQHADKGGASRYFKQVKGC